MTKDKSNNCQSEGVYRWNVSEAVASYDLAGDRIHPHYVEIQEVILGALPFRTSDSFTIMDAGGGSGRLLERILDRFPHARGLIVDQSEAFLALAERRLSRFGTRAECYCLRLQDDWPALASDEMHAIVSMSAIHHLDCDEKREFYRRSLQSLAEPRLLINGDEVRPEGDDAYLSELRSWSRHMRRLIAERLVPETMHETMNGWIRRNVDCFGEPKQSGDDCHETVDVQLGYLRDAGFAGVDVLWRNGLWAVFGGGKLAEDRIVKLPTRLGYDRWAAIYDDEDNPLVVLEHEHIERLFTDVCGLRVLDAGCGTGRHALSMAEVGAHVTAVDFSEGMLAKACAKPSAHEVEFLQHDLESPLPFANESFDRVISGLVVDHIEDLVGFFSELRRVCNPAGLVVITVMHPSLTLRQVQARFTDPDTGFLTLPASQTHVISDYVMAALTSGFSIKRMSEHLVNETLAARSDRARRYLGWPMLLVFELTP